MGWFRNDTRPTHVGPMFGWRWQRNLGVVLAGISAVLVVAACGSESDVETGVGAVARVDDAKLAMVQLEARGSFRDLDGSAWQFAGSGSGFIIDPSGIVVTNNHVVAGAASVIAYVGGSTSPITARILGVSECADLAVVQLFGGNFPYLGWFEGDIEPPLEVYAAGFPLGDPEFTLTRGVVSKARADGDWAWASVPRTLEHDANIQPGNSGGPLVTADGKVAGVNYAGYSPSNTTQFFAIAADVARPIIEQLAAGEDVDTLGINGEAVETDDGFTGIWIAGVTAGSPAANAGILPGDLLISLGGQIMGEDGTMRGYCDVLRTQGTDRTIAFEVYRDDIDQVLTGEINGRGITIAETSIPANVVDSSSGERPIPGMAQGFRTVADPSGRILVSVPTEWTFVETERIGPNAFLRAAAEPGAPDSFGITISVFDGVDPSAPLFEDEVEQIVNTVGRDCEVRESIGYDDGLYSGLQYLIEQCPGPPFSLRIYLVGPDSNQYAGMILLKYPRGREDIPIALTSTLYLMPA